MYGKKGENAINGKPIVMLDENHKYIRSFACKQAILDYLNLKGHTELNKAIKNNSLYKNYYWVLEKDYQNKSVETN